MPIIPDFKPAQGEYQPAAPSVAAAMAPGRAMEQFGESVGNAGDLMGRVVLKFQEAQDKGVKNYARLAIMKAEQEHQQFRIDSPDESTWEPDMKRRMADVQAKVAKQQMSPFGKAEMDSLFQGWQQDAISGVQLDAKVHSHKRAVQRTYNAAEAAIIAKQHGVAIDIFNDAAGSIMTREEADARINEVKKQQIADAKVDAVRIRRNTIAEDHEAWISSHDPFVPPEGVEPSEHVDDYRYAMSLRADKSRLFVDRIHDGMSSQNGQPAKIRKPEDIDEYAKNAKVSPFVVQKLKDELAQQQSEEFQLKRQTPEFQHQVVADVSEKLNDLDPNNYDQIMEVSSLVNQLPPGLLKNTISEEVSAKLSGNKDEGAMTMAIRQMDDAYRAGWFGTVKPYEGVPTMKMLNDGFLKSVDKLQSLGFSKEQAETIRDAKTGDKQTISAQVAKFRELWVQREGKDDKADPFVRALGDAVVNGKSRVMYLTPEDQKSALESRAQSLRKYGEARSELIRYAKAHKNLSFTELYEKAAELASHGNKAGYIDAVRTGYGISHPGSAADFSSDDPSMVLPPLDANDLNTLPPLNN